MKFLTCATREVYKNSFKTFYFLKFLSLKKLIRIWSHVSAAIKFKIDDFNQATPRNQANCHIKRGPQPNEIERGQFARQQQLQISPIHKLQINSLSHSLLILMFLFALWACHLSRIQASVTMTAAATHKIPLHALCCVFCGTPSCYSINFTIILSDSWCLFDVWALLCVCYVPCHSKIGLMCVIFIQRGLKEWKKLLVGSNENFWGC